MSSTAETVRNKKIPVVAIAGATGAVGVELMQCLEQRKFPLSELRLLASARSAGKTMKFRGGDIAVQELTDESLEGVDIALFSAGGAQSKRFAPAAVKAGAMVVDNSSAFRMDPDTPLVVPEINSGAIAKHNGIIANPNCVAIVAVTPLWPMHQKRRIQRITMSTYQAASGAGAAAMEELSESTRAFLEGRAVHAQGAAASVRVQRVLAQHQGGSGNRLQRGRNQGDAGDAQDLRRAGPARDRHLRARARTARALHRAEHRVRGSRCRRPRRARSCRTRRACAWSTSIEKNYFPMPVDASGKDEVLVGRIRKDVSDPSGKTLALFVAGDQLRKGAALNAVQIAERLLG